MTKASVYINKGSEITSQQKQRPYQNFRGDSGNFLRSCFYLPGSASCLGGDGDFSARW